MEQLIVEAEPRDTRGKNPARRLRRGGRVPGVVYGGKAESLAVSVDPRVVEKVLHSEAGHNAIFTLSIQGKGKTPAMIRDWQLEPVKGSLLHVDFVRIAMDARLKVKVPVTLHGEAIGVKQQGGILEVLQREVEIECLPSDIPDEFQVDVSELAIGNSFRVGDLKMDNRKLRVLTDLSRVVVHVQAPRAVEEEKPAEEAAVAVAAEPTEPELIRKRKAEAEGEEEGKEKKSAAREREEEK